MKALALLLFGACLFGADSSQHKSTMSGSRSTHHSRITRTLYNSDIIVVSDGTPIYLTVALESVIQTDSRKLEINLKLFEEDKLLTTKKVYVSW
jgi:hypothetical protein